MYVVFQDNDKGPLLLHMLQIKNLNSFQIKVTFNVIYLYHRSMFCARCSYHNKIETPHTSCRFLRPCLSARTPSFCKQYSSCQFYCFKIISYVRYKGISGGFILSRCCSREGDLFLLRAREDIRSRRLLFHSFLVVVCREVVPVTARGILKGVKYGRVCFAIPANERGDGVIAVIIAVEAN